MLEIIVQEDGALKVASFYSDGRLARVDDYASWSALFSQWGPRWSIDNRRIVLVRRIQQRAA